jgi:spectinomycin phosphotransferase
VHSGSCTPCRCRTGSPRWQPDRYQGSRSALDERDSSWASAGPFAEAARRLVRMNATMLNRRLDAFAAAAADLAARRHDVVTHGEPHAANVLVLAPGSGRFAHSRIALLDWDTVRSAPRERDLAVALPEEDSADLTQALEVYFDAAAGNPDSLDGDAIALFREEWALNDIDVYLTELRAPHRDTADTQAGLRYLEKYLTGGS